jgi:hypothetical protein
MIHSYLLSVSYFGYTKQKFNNIDKFISSLTNNAVRFITKKDPKMLFWERSDPYCENHTKQVNTLSAGNVEFHINVKARVTYLITGL